MQALVLAAGVGRRLRPLTDHQPKCMVKVGGQPLIVRALHAMKAAGIDEVVLVVGYQSDAIIEALGDEYLGMRMVYVDNPDYATTNNLYSLWLARDALRGPLLLLEADLLYDVGILEALVAHPESNVAIVDPYQAHMDGTVILAEEGSLRAESMVLKRDQASDFDYGRALKTVNLYKLSQELIEDQFLPALSEWVGSSRLDQYYEAVFADLIGQKAITMHALPIAPYRWAEVDDVADHERAEALFGAGATEN